MYIMHSTMSCIIMLYHKGLSYPVEYNNTAGMTLEDVRKYEDELQQQTNARVVHGLNTQEAS